MHSFIITTKDKQQREKYIANLCIEYAIDPFDITNLEQELPTIGIEQIRLLQKKLYLYPIKSKTKALIIQNAHTLTTEAQNALLKTLEEPPNNTIIILSADTHEAFLPTILSRCSLFKLNEANTQYPKEQLSNLHPQLITITNGKIGEKLKLAQEYSKTKETALTFLEQIIFLIRQSIMDNYLTDLQNKTPGMTNILLSCHKMYITIKSTNVNQRLALEHLFLSVLPM